MADNKTKYEVQVDIDVKSGDIDTDKLLSDVSKQIQSKLAAVKKSKVAAPIEFDVSKVEAELDTLASAIEKRLKRNLRNLRNSAGKEGASEALLGNITAAEKRLRDFTDKAKATHKELHDTAVAYSNATGKKLSSDRAKALADLKTHTSKQIVELSKSEKALALAKKAGYGFGLTLEAIGKKANSAAAAVKNLNKGVSKSFSAAFGGIKSETIQKAKGTSVATSSVDPLAKKMADSRKQVNAMTLGLAKMSAEWKKTNKTLEESEAALKKVDKELESTSAKLAHVRANAKSIKEVGNAEEILNSLKQESRAILDNMVALQKKIGLNKKAGKSTEDLERQHNKLSASYKRLEKSTRGPTKAMVEFTNSFKTFLRYAVAFRVFGGIERGFRSLITNVLELDDALVSIQAITKATSEEMVVMENAVKNVATTTQFTTQEIAQAAQTLAQGGVGPGQIAVMLQAVAQFAAATNASLTVAADLISTVKNVYGELGADEIADKLTNAVNISKLTATGLQTIFSRLAQTAKSFNVSLDQTLGAAAVLKNVGIKDSTISTGFRQGLLELLSPDAKTLKVLENRYAAIGEKMSKAAISTMFADFKNDDNPLLRVLNELEKLGIQGSGAQDFERLFDVRATNVIKALIANKEQFIKNTAAIQQTGSAAKGAQTQLESLNKAASNLVATVSVLAADLSGPLVDGFKDLVKWSTEATVSIREALLAQKELTGSSGVGASVELGVAAAGATAARGFGAGKAALVGLLSTGVASVINSTAGSGQVATEGITKTLSTLLETVAAVSIWKSLFPGKGKTADLSKMSKSAEALTKKSAGLKGALSKALSFITFGMSRLVLIPAAIFFFADILKGFFKTSLGDVLDTIDSQKQAVGKRVEEAKAEVAKVKSEIERVINQKTKSEGYARQISKIDDIVNDISVNKLADGVVADAQQLAAEVEAIISKEAAGVKDVGSAAFKDALSRVNEALKGLGLEGLSSKEFVEAISTFNELVVKAEGERLAYMEQLIAAQSDSTNADNAAFLAAHNKLSLAEQALYKGKITSNKEAIAFLQQEAKANEERFQNLSVKKRQLAEANKHLTETELTLLDLDLKALEETRAAADKGKLRTAFDTWLNQGPLDLLATILGGDNTAERALKAQKDIDKALTAAESAPLAGLSEKVEAGMVDIVEGLVATFMKHGLLSVKEAEAALETARQNSKKVYQAQIQKDINELDLSQRTETKLVPYGDPSVQDESVDKRAESKSALIEQDDKLILSLKDHYEKLKALNAEEVDRAKEIKAVEEEVAVVKKQRLDIDVKIKAISENTLKDAETLARLEQSFIPIQQELQALDKELARVKKAGVQDEEKFKEIVNRRFAVESQMLAAKEAALTEALRSQLIKKGKAATTDDLSTMMSKVISGGILLEKGSEEIARLMKEVGDVLTKRVTAEERYISELEGYIQKDLTKAEGELTTQKNKSLRIENELTQATDKLAVARDKLAAVYDKQAGDEVYFESIRRDADGEEALQGGDEKDLLKRAKEADSSKGAIALAKEAVSTAKSLAEEGKISKSDYQRIVSEATKVIKEARSSEIREAKADVQRQAKLVRALGKALYESIEAEKALEDSIYALKASMEALGKDLKAKKEEGEKKPTEIYTKDSGLPAGVVKVVDDKGNVSYEDKPEEETKTEPAESAYTGTMPEGFDKPLDSVMEGFDKPLDSVKDQAVDASKLTYQAAKETETAAKEQTESATQLGLTAEELAAVPPNLNEAAKALLNMAEASQDAFTSLVAKALLEGATPEEVAGTAQTARQTEVVGTLNNEVAAANTGTLNNEVAAANTGPLDSVMEGFDKPLDSVKDQAVDASKLTYQAADKALQAADTTTEAAADTSVAAGDTTEAAADTSVAAGQTQGAAAELSNTSGGLVGAAEALTQAANALAGAAGAISSASASGGGGGGGGGGASGGGGGGASGGGVASSSTADYGTDPKSFSTSSLEYREDVRTGGYGYANYNAVQNEREELSNRQRAADTSRREANNADRAAKGYAPASSGEASEYRTSSNSYSDGTNYVDPRKLAAGGPVKGPGSSTSDSIPALLSNNEFVQPAKATSYYGEEFMEKLRNLQIPVEAVRSIGDVSHASVSGNSGADALANAIKSATGEDLRPVTLNIAGASFSGKASDKSIDTFRSSLAMQALKTGKR